MALYDILVTFNPLESDIEWSALEDVKDVCGNTLVVTLHGNGLETAGFSLAKYIERTHSNVFDGRATIVTAEIQDIAYSEKEQEEIDKQKGVVFETVKIGEKPKKRRSLWESRHKH